MKKFKVMLSVFMVLVIISISVAPVFATDSDSSPQDVIGENLKLVMSEAEENEKIKVYIWYKDIDQNEVDRLTTKETGLSPESCEVITEFPSADVWASLEKGDKNAQKQMDEYMLRTKNAREKERNRTDTYSKKHREIANEKYRQKSQKIRQELYISESENVFSSEFAPMIIAEMTKDEILRASNNSNVEEINLYIEMEAVNPSVDADEGISAKQSMGLSDVYSVYGLTGDGVDVGLIESFVPGPVPLKVEGDTIIELEQLEIDLDDVIVVEVEGHESLPDKYTPDSRHSHSYNSFRVMAGCQTGIAKNINMYATNCDLANVEEMLKLETNSRRVIDVLEVNASYWVFDNDYVDEDVEETPKTINTDFAYDYLERYYDCLVSNHDITIVVAGGNRGSRENDYFGSDVRSDGTLTEPYWHAGARVTSPALAYNVIAVGGYNCCNTVSKTDDFLENYCWKDSYLDMHGCEKPDVVMPMNFPGGGTSVASPALTAQIALMLELKPSLALHPQAIKAIVLASCHRKVIQTSEQGGQETMAQGITERQGAGAPDAWTMACIISQGTYGVGALSSTSVSFNIIQPRYGADNMNVSIAWIRENTDTQPDYIGHYASDIIAGDPANLSLSIYNGDSVIGASSLQYSSTEMCYVPLSATDNKYKFTISQAPISVGVRFGYAWSTDDMKAAPVSNSGIYHISNKANGRYMTYNQTTSEHQAVQRAVTTQAAFSDMHNWVVKSVGDAYNLVPGGATTSLYLGVSTTLSGTSYKSKLDTVATPLKVEYNEDGTYSILNSNRDKILSYSGSSLVWNTYNGENSTPATNQSWYFAKVNYLVGDANADGYINASDATYIQNYLVGLNTPNNIRLYLSDADRDGVVSILDVYKINNIISGTVSY